MKFYVTRESFLAMHVLFLPLVPRTQIARRMSDICLTIGGNTSVRLFEFNMTKDDQL